MKDTIYIPTTANAALVCNPSQPVYAYHVYRLRRDVKHTLLRWLYQQTRWTWLHQQLYRYDGVVFKIEPQPAGEMITFVYEPRERVKEDTP